MIRSMTAFAASSYEGKEFTLDVFIRTYNHRFLDINLKLPVELIHIEGELRSMISHYLTRGRIEMTVKATFLEEGIHQILINKPLVGKLIAQIDAIKKQYGIKAETDLSSLLRTPGLIEVQTDVHKISAEILSEIKEIVQTCLKSLLQMRANEGQNLAKDIRERLESLLKIVEKVEINSKDYPKEVRLKLEKNLKEILNGQNVDPNRLLQEVAYYSERSDITEELVRLRSHILQCEKLIEGDEATGRKLDFLLQEILREINTMGSKCDLLTVSKDVIEMKTEVEKIREQIQNVE